MSRPETFCVCCDVCGEALGEYVEGPASFAVFEPYRFDNHTKANRACREAGWYYDAVTDRCTQHRPQPPEEE